jgi:hypothetical protein
MKKYYEIAEVKFGKDKMIVVVNGEVHEFNLAEVSPRLPMATKVERETFEISSSGYGIHWPILDEDLSIDGHLGIVHKPQLLKKAV